MNVHVEVFVRTTEFDSFRYTPNSGIAALYGHSMFNLLRNHQTVFHSSCFTCLPAASEGSNFSAFLPALIFHFFFFLIMAILMGVQQYFKAILIQHVLFLPNYEGQFGLLPYLSGVFFRCMLLCLLQCGHILVLLPLSFVSNQTVNSLKTGLGRNTTWYICQGLVYSRYWLVSYKLNNIPFFFYFLKFIGVTLINKIIQVSSIQVCNISPV